MKLLISIIAFAALAASAQTTTFVWTPPSGGAIPIHGYRLYANTNTIVPATAPVKVDCGTNTMVSVDNPTAGLWRFAVASYSRSTNGTNIATIESVLSNELILRVPQPPANMATMTVQWIGEIASTNWNDIGFFRIKLGQ